VMAVPGRGDPWSPDNHCGWPDPSSGIWMHHHELNYPEFWHAWVPVV
jgi:hypothetical protein